MIAVEDSRFERHHGVDPLAIVRALWTDLKTKSLAEGGSTLTQQLAKNVYFTQEKHFARKAAELFAAVDIEKHYGKQQIFEMYVNTIYFGSGYYGIAEAAQGYFGKTPAELTSAECVLLAGLPNAPSAYSPNSSPALALKRSQVVLDRMVSAKKLTKIQAMELHGADDEPVQRHAQRKAHQGADEREQIDLPEDVAVHFFVIEAQNLDSGKFLFAFAEVDADEVVEHHGAASAAAQTMTRMTT